jgi:hypothetical protein
MLDRFRSLRAPLAAVLLIAIAGDEVPRFVPDSDFYIRVALGQRSTVPAPFSQRVAHPGAVAALNEFGVSLPAAFFILAIISLVGLCVGVRVLLNEAPSLAVVSVLAVPLLVMTYREAYLPDLAFAALLAGFFVLLRNRLRWWAPLALIPLFLVRESALLVGIVVAVVAWRHHNRPVACSALAATVIGYGVSTVAALGGQPSLHNVGGPLYLIGKLPYNGIKNLTGFAIATNDRKTCAPFAEFDLPWAVGNISTVGICPLNLGLPIMTLAAWLTLFGLAPALLLAVLRHTRDGRSRDVWVQAALWSGLLAFVAAPLLGATVRRLIGYGWPALIVVMPLLLLSHLHRRAALSALVASFALAWMPVLVNLVAHGDAGNVVIVVVALPAQVATFYWAKRRLSSSVVTVGDRS